MNNVIHVDNEIIPKIDDNENFFLNRLTMLYGTSGSGKSSLLMHILNTLKSYIPNVIVACESSNTNDDYKGVIPDQCVHTDVTKKLIQQIFQRQKNIIAMYDLVRDIQHIKPIYELVHDNVTDKKLQELRQLYNTGVKECKQNYDLSQLSNKLEDLEAKYNAKCIKFMRNAIKKKLNRLASMPLTEVQRSMILHFNINPNLLFIIDDCAASIKEWKDLEETKKLFFQGRHYRITTLITFQNESIIPPFLRTNAHISIFTTEEITNTFYDKKSSGATKEFAKKIGRIASVIFKSSNDKDKPNYKKLVVLGAIIKTNHRIQYMVGTPSKRRFGSKALWAFCDEIKRTSSNIRSSSAFTKMFEITNEA